MARHDLNKCKHQWHTISHAGTHLSLSKGTEAMSMLSIDMVPTDSSIMRNKALNKLDFPAPVLPTTPI